MAGDWLLFNVGRWTLDLGRSKIEPRLDVLLKTFLGFEAVCYDNDWPLRKDLAQKNAEKGLSGGVDADTGQCAAILQSPQQGLHSGSLRNLSEQIACRGV